MRAGTWWPWRRRVALLAVLVAALTGAAAAALGGGSGSAVYGAALYLVATLLALLAPGLLIVQVAVGQLLVAGVLLTPGDVELLSLLPLAAGVVASAELLGAAARLDMSVERHPGPDLRRVGLAALVGTGAFGAVAWVAGFPGPSGLLAVAVASGACVALAVVLVRGVA